MRRIILLLAVLLPNVAVAGGSFRVDTELDPILKQVPDIKRYLFKSLDIHWTGSAGRIGQSVNPRFGGRRIGPYRVAAKPKGTEGDFTLELIVHTKRILTDAEGEPTDLANAEQIREEFVCVEIKPLARECNASSKPEARDDL